MLRNFLAPSIPTKEDITISMLIPVLFNMIRIIAFRKKIATKRFLFFLLRMLLKGTNYLYYWAIGMRKL